MMKLSLRIRITALVGIIMIAITVILTLVSIYSADNYFGVTEANFKSFSVTTVSGDVGEDSLGNYRFSVSEAQMKFSISSLIAMCCLTLAGILLTYFITGRALKPLSDLSKGIKDISEKNLSTRIDIPSTHNEVGSLTICFNAMLDRLDRSFARQKRFAASAAHELRTPLSTMKASYQVLHLDEEPALEDYKAYSEATNESAERMILLVEDLLKLSVEGHTDFNDHIELSTVFEDIRSELLPLATRKNNRMIIHPCNSRIKGNKTLLHRAIFNLVENAIKYNKPNGKIDLSARIDAEFVIINIRDTGIGIPQKDLENVFEPFYRVDQSRSRDIAGSGLGLALVETIIHKHQGKVEMNSTIGKGTSVEIRLPADT